MGLDSRLNEDREFVERTLILRTQAVQLFRRFGLQAGDTHEVPTDDGFLLAFGYRAAAPEGGPRQRYVEIPITYEEYATVDAAVQAHILDQLRQELEHLPHAQQQ